MMHSQACYPFSMRRLAGFPGLLLALHLAGLGCEGDTARESAEELPAETMAAPTTTAGLPEPPPGTQASIAPPPTRVDLEQITSNTLGDHVGDRYSASLEKVLEKGFLRVLTSRNSFDFFIHQGARGGYQYEMVKAFTRFLNRKHRRGRAELNVQFELIPVDDDQLIPMLRDGAADLIAARLTVTPDRSEVVRFSNPYRSVDELLVTHDETPPLDSIEDLSGRSVAVRASSSYHESLVRLNRQLTAGGLAPVHLESVDEALETERILELVAERRFSYTVADSIVAQLAVALEPRLQVVEGVTLRQGGKLAWATQPEASALLGEMNAFLSGYNQGSLLGNLANQKYFEPESRLAAWRRESKGTALSPFDDIFKRHAERFELDWLLVAAMAHQESRFDPTARNPSGAVGLLQIKPTTAREPYVDIPNVEGTEFASNNVEAGLKYLTWIKARYFDSVPAMREKDRVRMALAAYNAGPRAVLRARSRARKLGYDPNRWFRNVELSMLDMRKTEPVKYVSEINQRYLAYLLLLENR
jgi:membrane-bound lytic murein transglycosylase MltF